MYIKAPTDGRYILLWKEKIYELYMNAFDVGNNFDLLSLFNIDENDTFSLKETMRDITNSHFKYAMSESRIREIQMEYKKLKKALMEEVKCLENTMEVQYEKL